MTNKLKYHKNYTEFGEPYQLVLPLNYDIRMNLFLPPFPEHFIFKNSIPAPKTQMDSY